MEGAGPSHGEAVDTNWALAGTNAVEVDAVCAHLLGFDPADIGYLYLAHQEGLGEIELSKIDIKGEEPQAYRRQIRPHPNHQQELTWKNEI